MQRRIENRSSADTVIRTAGVMLMGLVLLGCTETIASTMDADTASDSRVLFHDDFSAHASGACAAEGSRLGGWSVVYTGYGCVGIEENVGGASLRIAPQQVSRPQDTSAPLVVGPSFDHLDFIVTVQTAAQLRQNTEPNPWEVGWVIWNYTDPEHFYYFIVKPNGWELGKRDPAYPGGQRFLATGDAPRKPVGTWHQIRVLHSGASMTVAVDGERVISYEDAERPYLEGRIGLYSEDADVRFADVSVRSLEPGFSHAWSTGSPDHLPAHAMP